MLRLQNDHHSANITRYRLLRILRNMAVVVPFIMRALKKDEQQYMLSKSCREYMGNL